METRERITAYRFRAYPTDEQAAVLRRWQGAQRWLWNQANAQRIAALEGGRDAVLRNTKCAGDQAKKRNGVSAFDQCRELTVWRSEHEWLSLVPCSLQQSLLRDLDEAWKRCFSKKAKRPKFKSRDHWAPMTLPAVHCGKRICRRAVSIPKIGDVRLRGDRPVIGKPLKVAITMEAGDQWFVSITVRLVEQVPAAPAGEPIGLDFGVANIVADSEGRVVENPRHADAMATRVARAQRVVARRKPKPGQRGSKNYRKAQERVAKLQQKIRRQRADMQHNITSRYAKAHGAVVIEDLNVSAMMRSAKGTVAEPGVNVRAKSGLNRSIAGVGWYAMRVQLAQKTARYGGTLITVDPRYTSQACSECGHVDRENRKTQASFVCVACGARKHADVNAAKNILSRGVSPVTAGTPPDEACGGVANRQPVKQEGDGASRPDIGPVRKGKSRAAA